MTAAGITLDQWVIVVAVVSAATLAAAAWYRFLTGKVAPPEEHSLNVGTFDSGPRSREWKRFSCGHEREVEAPVAEHRHGVLRVRCPCPQRGYIVTNEGGEDAEPG